jgi:hypothetical protein
LTYPQHAASHLHRRVTIPQDIQSQDELIRDIGDEHPDPEGAPPEGQLHVPVDAVCRTYDSFGFLSGIPATMSGLAMVTDAPVSMVTRQDLSCIQPSAIKLSSVHFASTFTVSRGDEATEAGGPSTRRLSRFPMLGP